VTIRDMSQPAPNPISANESADRIFPSSDDGSLARVQGIAHTINGATCVDLGIATRGNLAAGQLLARICMADRANISLRLADSGLSWATAMIDVATDQPVVACLGSQYAGWPVQTDDYFAMGSGPMRLARGREKMLDELSLGEKPSVVVGVLESDKMPTPSAIEAIASDCGVHTNQIRLAIAPSTSIAGSYQVVARCIETAMHKLHELKYDITKIVSATGTAPLPPPAKPGKSIAGIGRTNDAILYGGVATMWVDDDDESIASIIAQVPSQASSDYGQPFAKIFKAYDYDFYKVDPMLFSPARIVVHCLKSGHTFTAGHINPNVLIESFA
jgi:methenyltetrahydromethanopterin cyclohydrolase